MANFGFGMGFVSILNVIIILAWIVLAILCLINLGKRQMPETPKALWAAIILIIPVFGAIAFLIVKPGSDQHSEG
jgi:apolipoprotein N-acyltransferase